MDRFRWHDNRVRPDAFIAFFLGVVVAYLVLKALNLRPNLILVVLIVGGIGGFWYHWRRIV